MSKVIHLRFFASVRERLNCSAETVDVPTEIENIAQLRLWLIQRGGAWAEALALEQQLRTAYQQELCEESVEIADGAEIAFFPPVTGG